MSGVELSNEMREKISMIVDRVIEMFRPDTARLRIDNPFHALVAIILSQKTSTRNVRAAMERFRARFSGAEAVASASLKSIQDAIKPAGLWRMKAPRIKLIARQIADKNIDLEKVLSMPYPEARRILSSLKGVGPKTADVFLMFARDEQILPIDTHIFRVMRRLGIAGEREGYESLKSRLESVVEPEKRIQAHLALIEFGRKICAARNPRCSQCPFSKICPSSRARK
ncbi:MAG: endonuclease III [Nitrososphaerota archaeon]